MGGIKFELQVRVALTDEEVDLVKKYKVNKESILKKVVKVPLTSKTLPLDLTIESLIAGRKFKSDDIAEILEYEKIIKEFCEAFKNNLEVMKNFGGREVIEYK